MPDHDLRGALGTLAHNRQFTLAELREYARTDTRAVVRHLLRDGLIARVGRGKYFPTRKGWAWIEGRES